MFGENETFLYFCKMKEIIETYKIYLQDYDDNGHRQSDGVSLRDVLFEFERDFHQRHSTCYALFTQLPLLPKVELIIISVWTIMMLIMTEECQLI